MASLILGWLLESQRKDGIMDWDIRTNQRYGLISKTLIGTKTGSITLSESLKTNKKHWTLSQCSFGCLTQQMMDITHLHMEMVIMKEQKSKRGRCLSQRLE